ncbi:MAG TPA: cyclic 2,3-diphosphoglycerate synthase [Hyphomicrobiaceae bacterium]|nr:cyclic 2,3-diphosphoglycerate synthase [Hyphomicrobiaceae bacterium]
MSSSGKRKRVLIMGAAGRDFHNFNVAFRDDPGCEVVAFTAAQIPGISGRRYPAALAGDRYPDGIAILEETQLADVCREKKVDEVVFAYSDVEHAFVMHKASIALAAGADFTLLGPKRTMLTSRLPVIAICAVRTGVGKSQTARWLARLLKERGLRVAAIRHPMPYGDLERQAVQRFARFADLDAAQCTIEEREEYEPHIRAGNTVFAGVDYARILALAETESDIIVWDGGNNDFSFVQPDLHIVLVDPLRPGHETTHHPGEAVLRTADIVVVAKTNSASAADIHSVTEAARRLAPKATVVRAASIVTLDDPAAVAGKSVLVVDDGPTITHGGMAYGAGYVAASQAGVKEIVDPRLSAVGDIAEVFRQYPHIGKVLPAMGYSAKELGQLQATINGSSADAVIGGTPSDLAHLMRLDKPVVRARYEFAEVGEPRLSGLVEDFLRSRGILKGSGAA